MERGIPDLTLGCFMYFLIAASHAQRALCDRLHVLEERTLSLYTSTGYSRFSDHTEAVEMLNVDGILCNCLE